MGALFENFLNPEFLVTFLTAIAVAATVITLGLPYLQGNLLQARMKYVAVERDEIRKRERARLMAGNRTSLRNEDKKFASDIVDRLNLRKAFLGDDTVMRLKMAGFRGQGPVTMFLFLRLILPFAFFFSSVIYLFVLTDLNHTATMKLVIAVGIGYVGLYAPNLYVSNRIKKRQDSVRRAWPDALDLMLICVESGQSIEAAFRKVAEEMGIQSVPLAEEMALTTAELSYLEERRQAYENLGKRTGLDGVKAVVTSLIQAEKYGTPLGHALRVMAQENRDMRMAMAEKKAAALPPKLTVPMILFFLPVLFIVILGPAAIQVMAVDR